MTAADGSVTATQYTADGYAAKVTYPDQTVTSTYDAVGNRVGMTDSLGESSWAYDWAGRVTSETDARGHTQTHAFDAVGNEVPDRLFGWQGRDACVRCSGSWRCRRRM